MRMLDQSARKRSTVSSRPPSLSTRGRRVAVFTSIEGTLVDRKTFDLEPNRQTLARLASAGVPLVPVTVMTLDEVEPIVRELPNVEVMIVEAGGAIARRIGAEWSIEPLGPEADMLLDVIAEIEERSGASLLVCSACPGSTRRSFSEPFVLESGDLERVIRAAASIGYAVRRGPRFLHLCQTCDKGAAFDRVRAELACDVTIGIGSSPVDAEFLRRCNIPIVLPAPDEPDRELLREAPNARVAPAQGPEGWSAAVERAIDEDAAG